MNEKLLKRIGEVVPGEVLQSLLDEWDPIVRVESLELEAGFYEFNVKTLERWFHPKQIKGNVTKKEILDELIDKNLLEGCLGLADLQAIQARGVKFFLKHFARKRVFAWKFIDCDSPSICLFEHCDEVCLNYNWDWLHAGGAGWNSLTPALRFAS